MSAPKKVVQTPLVCHGHTRPIVELQFSAVTPDGYFLTSASKDGQPMLRNGETGDWIGTFQGHKGAVWSCVLNDPALLAATASADFSARVWNAITGDELHKFDHKHVVRSVAFSHGESSAQLASGGLEKVVRVFDLQRPDAEPSLLPASPDSVRTLLYMPGNQLLLASYVDKPNTDVYDMRTQQVVRTLESGGAVTSTEITPCGGFIVTADGLQVCVRSASSFEVVKTLATDYPVESASYCPERQRLVAGGADMWVHLYDATTNEQIDCSKGHHGPVHCVRFAPGGATYASGSEDGTIRIWRTDFVQEAQQAAAADAAAAATANGTAAAAAPPAPATTTVEA